MKEPPKIINYIEINGKEVLFDDLPEEQRKQKKGRLKTVGRDKHGRTNDEKKQRSGGRGKGNPIQ